VHGPGCSLEVPYSGRWEDQVVSRSAGVTNRERYTPEHFAELREQWLKRRTEARKAKATITLAELYGILVEVAGEIDEEKRP